MNVNIGYRNRENEPYYDGLFGDEYYNWLEILEDEEFVYLR